MSLNLPNQITLARLVLAIVFFVLLNDFNAEQPERSAYILDICLGLFVVAALTDVLDGYLARSRNQVTSLGRVLDPFVDKVLICGAYAYFAGPGFVDATGTNVTGVDMWMVVVILGRELLVTGLRGFSEAQGAAFAAGISGKTKMIVQSVTAGVILLTVSHPQFLVAESTSDIIRLVFVRLTVIVTAISLATYLWRARKVLFGQTGA